MHSMLMNMEEGVFSEVPFVCQGNGGWVCTLKRGGEKGDEFDLEWIDPCQWSPLSQLAWLESGVNER